LGIVRFSAQFAVSRCVKKVFFLFLKQEKETDPQIFLKKKKLFYSELETRFDSAQTCVFSLLYFQLPNFLFRKEICDVAPFYNIRLVDSNSFSLLLVSIPTMMTMRTKKIIKRTIGHRREEADPLSRARECENDENTIQQRCSDPSTGRRKRHALETSPLSIDSSIVFVFLIFSEKKNYERQRNSYYKKNVAAISSSPFIQKSLFERTVCSAIR